MITWQLCSALAKEAEKISCWSKVLLRKLLQIGKLQNHWRLHRAVLQLLVVSVICMCGNLRRVMEHPLCGMLFWTKSFAISLTGSWDVARKTRVKVPDVFAEWFCADAHYIIAEASYPSLIFQGVLIGIYELKVWCLSCKSACWPVWA